MWICHIWQDLQFSIPVEPSRTGQDPCIDRALCLTKKTTADVRRSWSVNPIGPPHYLYFCDLLRSARKYLYCSIDTYNKKVWLYVKTIKCTLFAWPTTRAMNIRLILSLHTANMLASGRYPTKIAEGPQSASPKKCEAKNACLSS